MTRDALKLTLLKGRPLSITYFMVLARLYISGTAIIIQTSVIPPAIYIKSFVW